MAVPLLASAATAATAAYLDAKFHIRHDLSLSSLKPSPEFIDEKVRQDRVLLYHLLEDQVNLRPDHLFLIFEGKTWTYEQFFKCVHRVGNWLMKDLNIQRGEIVPLDATNTPEYIMLWLALDGIGAIPAFINHNLTSTALVHCVKLCEARYVIVTEDVKHLVSPSEGEFKELGIEPVYCNPEFLASLPDDTPIPQSRRTGIPIDSIGCLIYTSGTTGLPKATMLLVGRRLNTHRSVAMYLKLKPSDRMFTCMPLFHGAAHGLLVGPCIYSGATVCLGRRFSHRTFWPEVVRSEANILQYVGELCRYLVNAPPSPLDKQHKVEMAWGNGMRPDVWERFRERFGITQINELYAATDGLGSSFNLNKGEFSRNAIAKRGLLWHVLNGKNEVRAKVDPVTEELLRDENGFAVKCKTDESGEVLHKVDLAEYQAQFAGYYKNPEASQKRLIFDVFQKGDVWFRSGDMMRETSDGLVYFVDRLGDTFRWKSENVSTNEVADVVGQFDQIAESNVYGVEVPNADGRCGCAAVTFVDGVTEDTFQWEGLAKWVTAQLPAYARPFFIRVGGELEVTGTLKLQKGRLKKEGVDPALVTQDRIYWLPPVDKGSVKYVKFTKEDWESLKSGRIKF